MNLAFYPLNVYGTSRLPDAALMVRSAGCEVWMSTDLEHMKGLKLDGPRLVFQQDHHELQVHGISHISQHDFAVCTV